MAITKKLGNSLVPKLLEHLSAHAELPTTGILAGQAVASAIMDLLGAGTGVYNDIDVFVVADASKEAELSSDEHLKSEALKLGLPVAALDEYRQMTLDIANELEILGATQDGLLNYVWCRKTGPSLNGPRVLYSFDLNCVEVAVDLATKELFWSRAFEHFLLTRELQVTSLMTPARTLLRYFKKREELHAFGDDGLVMDMLASWTRYAVSPKPTASKLSLKHQRLAKRFEDKYLKFFDFDEAEQSLDIAEEWAVTPRFENILALVSDENETEGLTRLVPLMAYGQSLKRSKSLEAMLLDDLTNCNGASADDDGGFSGFAPQSMVAKSLALLKHDYIADHRTKKHYELVEAMLFKHPGLCKALFGLSLDEQYHCVRDIRSRAKKEGDYLYGAVEADALPSDMWNQSHRDAFFKRVAREESQTQLAPPLLEGRTCAGLRVRELLTTKELRIEGAQMRHCVGGYSSALSQGSSRILSIRDDCNPEKWSTAEIQVSMAAQTLGVKQHYAQGNTKVSESNKQALTDYLAEEASRMGFTVKERASFDAGIFNW